jgi:hypothetical protein
MNQKPAQEALAALIERLSSSDPELRMPKGTAMSSPERQELFLWAQETLSRIAKGAVR